VYVWAALNDALRTLVRESVKSDGHGGNVGYDAAKQIKSQQACSIVNDSVRGATPGFLRLVNVLTVA
jgi:hypothetical protein